MAGRTKRAGLWWWLPVAGAVAFVAVLAVAVLRPAGDSPELTIGRPAPDFTLSLYGSGKPLRLSSLRGKTVVLNFWWSGCPPCRQEAPILERQWQKWRGKGVVFVGVDQQQNETGADAPRRFLRAFGITYPNGPDPNDLSIQYGTTGAPETFFITPRGIIAKKYAMPFQDGATLSRLIEEARS